MRNVWQADRARAPRGATLGHGLHQLSRGQAALTAADPPLVDIASIRAAARAIQGVALRTPLVAYGRPEAGRFLKAESLQPIGAFKIRGAYFLIASLPQAERAAGVITYSSGNHAQAVARAARLLGIPAVIVMPSSAPEVKVAGVRADGAEIVFVGPSSDERQTVAERLAAERGLAIVPPFDDDRIIAGQGTVGLEIVEDLPDVAAVLVPLGGGGLAAGVAAAVKALRPQARVIAVEPALAADGAESLASGHIVAWPAERTSRTIADGARVQSIGRRNFDHLSRLLDAVVTVSDEEMAVGVRLATERSRLVVEPTGALALAAMEFHAAEAGIEGLASVVAVISGGNVDPEAYRRYLEAPLPGP